MNKRIVYIGNFSLPDKNAAAHRVIGNAKALRECGYDVVFVGLSDDECKDSVLESRFVFQGFTMYSRSKSQKKTLQAGIFTDIHDYVEVIESTSNVMAVVCYNLSSVLTLKMMKYCKMNGIVCTGDITEWRSTKGRNWIVKVLKGLDILLTMRFVYKKFDGLVVISDFLNEYYKKCHNVIEVPPLVDISEKKWNIIEDKRTDNILKLVYAGSPGQKDRVDILIEAILKVNRQVCLDIVGISENDFVKLNPDYSNVVFRDYGILFHGRIGHKDTLELVKRADYSCFFRDISKTSMAGFPTKLVEAISCGTPVLTNRTSNIGKYVIDNGGILFETTSIEKIVDAIESAKIDSSTVIETFDYRQYNETFKEWANSLEHWAGS